MSELSAREMRGVAWPSNGLTEIPFRLYTDPEQYQIEQERIFKGPTWNFLCLAAEIANPGDYVATTVGETSVIVTRDGEGQINAIVNRCAHLSRPIDRRTDPSHTESPAPYPRT